jgi:hypothetical protein
MRNNIIALILATFTSSSIINRRAPYYQGAAVANTPTATPCTSEQEANNSTTSSITSIQTTTPLSNFTTTVFLSTAVDVFTTSLQETVIFSTEVFSV